MPDDALFFVPVLDDHDTNDIFMTKADKLVADTIFSLQTMHRDSDTSGKSHTVETKAVEWEDNVPPDFTDDFMFML